MSSRLLLAVAVLLAVAAAAWWTVSREGAQREAAAPSGASRTQAPAQPASLAPLPRLTVHTSADAGVEVKLRGQPLETGCATGGTAEPLCPGQYDVRAEAGGQLGLAVVRLARGEDRTLELPLEKPGTLELTVMDDEKLPVDRATVIAEHARTGYLLRGRTDSDGTVSIGPVISGEWRVVASRDGWSPGAAVATPGRSTTLRLGNLGLVEGTLQPPATGARLELRTLEHLAVATAFTDGGVFRLGPVPPGKYELAVRDDGFEPRSEPVTVPASGVTFRASTGATLKGDLVGPGRERLSGTVTFDGPGPSRTVTAKDGEFVAHALAPGRWRLQSGDGRTWAFIDGGISRVELVVPKFDGVIAGTCGHDGGHRLPAELTVRATSEDGERSSAAACDAGRFELAGLAKGYYALDVDAREGLERWATHLGSVSTGTRDVRVTAPGVAWLSYRLVDETGRPIDGEQRREHFESRDVELTLHAPGHVAITRIASLERGRDTRLGDVTLHAGQRLSGRVLDAVTKDPIAGATVTIGGADQLTAKDGTFSSSDAPEGDVEVRAAHPRYVTQVRGAEAPGELEVELQHAARITGALITADGAAPRDVEVWAMSGADTVRAAVHDGLFATPHLSDGRWLLRVMPLGDAADVSGFDTVEVDLMGPGDRSVALVQRAAGTSFEASITDREGAAVASDVLLVPRREAAPANDEQFARLLRRHGVTGGPTAVMGRYRFTNVPPGAYTLVASARGRVWTAAMPVLVQTGMAPVRLSFEQLPYSP